MQEEAGKERKPEPSEESRFNEELKKRIAEDLKKRIEESEKGKIAPVPTAIPVYPITHQRSDAEVVMESFKDMAHALVDMEKTKVESNERVSINTQNQLHEQRMYQLKTKHWIAIIILIVGAGAGAGAFLFSKPEFGVTIISTTIAWVAGMLAGEAVEKKTSRE